MTRTKLRIHFVHRHVRDTVVITEEGNHPHPHPRCPAYEMVLPWAVLNCRHPAMSLCVRGAERKRRRLEEEEDWAVKVTELWDYDRTLETVP